MVGVTLLTVLPVVGEAAELAEYDKTASEVATTLIGQPAIRPAICVER
ncbi:MAG: hypothetical protein NNA24_06470 [Nitrospira sp.]|nr:hypothetical protein [Nitrospira sp.]